MFFFNYVAWPGEGIKKKEKSLIQDLVWIRALQSEPTSKTGWPKIQKN